MKKYLLSLAGVAMMATSAMAAEKTVNFDFYTSALKDGTPQYGLPEMVNNATTFMELPTTLTNENVQIVLNRTESGNGNFALYNMNALNMGSYMGLRASDTGATMNISVPNGKITGMTMTLTMATGFDTITANGESLTYPSTKIYTWTGNTDNLLVEMSIPNSGKVIKYMTVTYEEGEEPAPTPQPGSKTLDFTAAAKAGSGYGMTTGTTSTTPYLESPFTITDGPVQLVLTKEGNNANGFRLFNQNGNSSKTTTGLQVGATTNTGTAVITVSAPTGTITGVKMHMASVSGFTTLNFNDEAAVELDSSENYTWTSKDENGVETVKITMASAFLAKYIDSITVDYIAVVETPALLPADLAFSNADDLVGVKDMPFTAPTLENPNGLAVTWSSSNEAIATVDAEGKVTIVGSGSVTITASSEATDKYEAGSASYKLTAYGNVANNAEQMVNMAPSYNKQVYVNFPMTVTYVNKKVVFAIDAENHGIQLNVTNSLKEGDVIPAGWVATCVPQLMNVAYQGTLPASTETAEFTIPNIKTIPVKEIGNNRVYNVFNVTFDKDITVASNKAFEGKLEDGSSIDLYAAFVSYTASAPLEAGTYNVKAAVCYVDDDYLALFGGVLYPIEFTKVVPEPEFEFPTSLNATSTAETEEYTFTAGDEMDTLTATLNLAEGAESAVLTIEIPEGWDAIYHSPIEGSDISIGGDPVLRPQFAKATDFAWTSAEQFEAAGFVKGNEITLAASSDPYEIQLYLAHEDQVCVSKMIFAEVTVKAKEVVKTPEFPASLTATVEGAVSSNFSYNDAEDLAEWNATIKTVNDNVVITIDMPEGWDTIYHTPVEGDDTEVGGGPVVDDEFGVSVPAYVAEAEEDYDWMSPADFEAAGYPLTASNVITLPAPEESNDYEVQIYLGFNGKIYAAKRVLLAATVENSTVSVTEIEAADANAEYFTLQGVKVAGNPAEGLYIKVLNGKATKVLVK